VALLRVHERHRLRISLMETPRSRLAWLVTAIAVSMSGFHLYVGWYGAPDAIVLRVVHLVFALLLAFLILPARASGAARHPGLADAALVGASLLACGYLLVERDYVLGRMMYVDDLRPLDILLAWTTVLLVLEATRRAVGLTLPLTAIAFLAYAFLVAGADVEQLAEQMYLGTEGIFGVPIYVSATYVMLFILFGAIVERTGTGQLLMDFAMSLAGHTAGGPAKVACAASGMFGTISGSAVANVMTTGTFTIPLMKRIGYRPAFAGAVEAVASTGGQIMPPIMGAAAFIMAEFLGISYLQVTIFALVPALLYYLAVFLSLHFEASRGHAGPAARRAAAALQPCWPSAATSSCRSSSSSASCSPATARRSPRCAASRRPSLRRCSGAARARTCAWTRSSTRSRPARATRSPSRSPAPRRASSSASSSSRAWDWSSRTSCSRPPPVTCCWRCS
jgi:TRAP transporter 4TM/12TM fusion protein